jgi:hypothetical protein
MPRGTEPVRALLGQHPLDRGARPRGLWRQPHIPHHGWSCVEIEDLGRSSNTVVCEMCRSKRIRFVHSMTHQDFPFGELRAGCVCAERMSRASTEPMEVVK